MHSDNRAYSVTGTPLRKPAVMSCTGCKCLVTACSCTTQRPSAADHISRQEKTNTFDVNIHFLLFFLFCFAACAQEKAQQTFEKHHSCSARHGGTQQWRCGMKEGRADERADTFAFNGPAEISGPINLQFGSKQNIRLADNICLTTSLHQ